MSENLKTWPERLYLQNGAEESIAGEAWIPPYDECFEVTHCEDRINDNDVEYIRADLAQPSLLDACRNFLRYWGIDNAKAHHAVTSMRELVGAIVDEERHPAEIVQPSPQNKPSPQQGAPIERASDEVLAMRAQIQETLKWQAKANEYRDKLTALQQPIKIEWQPIETAPKDGFHILLYKPEIIYVGFWSGCDWCANANGCPRIESPTHWMPLPDAPLLAGKESK